LACFFPNATSTIKADGADGDKNYGSKIPSCMPVLELAWSLLGDQEFSWEIDCEVREKQELW
jgi:hypothetical protein